MSDFIFTLLELLGYFAMISLGFSFLVFVWAFVVYNVSEIRARRSNDKFNELYFKEIEEFRHDFS